MKLTTLHRTIKPELLDQPNIAGHRGGRRPRRRRHHPGQPVHDRHLPAGRRRVAGARVRPPDTRYWNVTLENIWHECLEPRRRHSSVTNKGVTPDADGMVRIAIGANDFGHGHWLDTGGRHRGFVVLRWLDNPDPPEGVGRRCEAVRRSSERRRPLRPRRADRTGLRVGGQRRLRGDFDGRDWRDGLGRLCRWAWSTRPGCRRPRRGDRGAGSRARAEESAADRRLAQGAPRDRRGDDRAADLHRRPAAHRHHDPVRPARPGPAAARRR